MENFQVYRDIQARTGGDIYIGVVGPVRTGKSTFIRRFMEQTALPVIDSEKQGENPGSAAFERFRKTDHDCRTEIYSKRSGSRHVGRRSESQDTSD